MLSGRFRLALVIIECGTKTATAMVTDFIVDHSVLINRVNLFLILPPSGRSRIRTYGQTL